MAEDGRRLLGADDGGAEWREYTPYGVVGVDHDYDDDEAVEDYYMSAAAGRARVIFGNRRWGNSGCAPRAYLRCSKRPVAVAECCSVLQLLCRGPRSVVVYALR